MLRTFVTRRAPTSAVEGSPNASCRAIARRSYRRESRGPSDRERSQATAVGCQAVTQCAGQSVHGLLVRCHAVEVAHAAASASPHAAKSFSVSQINFLPTLRREFR